MGSILSLSTDESKDETKETLPPVPCIIQFDAWKDHSHTVVDTKEELNARQQEKQMVMCCIQFNQPMSTLTIHYIVLRQGNIVHLHNTYSIRDDRLFLWRCPSSFVGTIEVRVTVSVNGGASSAEPMTLTSSTKINTFD